MKKADINGDDLRGLRAHPRAGLCHCAQGGPGCQTGRPGANSQGADGRGREAVRKAEADKNHRKE